MRHMYVQRVKSAIDKPFQRLSGIKTTELIVFLSFDCLESP